MFIKPRQQLQVPVLNGALTRLGVPRAVVLPRPLDHLCACSVS